jgi:hypothetical protein
MNDENSDLEGDPDGIEVEVDGISSSSSSYADFGDRSDDDDYAATNADIINIREIDMDTDSSDGEFDYMLGANALFPATNLVLQLSPLIAPEAIAFLVSKISEKKSYGGAELLVRCEPYNNGKDESLVLHVTANILRFLEVAEFLGLKKLDATGALREFHVRELDDFLHGEILLDSIITPAEKQLIVLNELQGVRALPGSKLEHQK